MDRSGSGARSAQTTSPKSRRQALPAASDLRRSQLASGAPEDRFEIGTCGAVRSPRRRPGGIRFRPETSDERRSVPNAFSPGLGKIERAILAAVTSVDRFGERCTAHVSSWDVAYVFRPADWTRSVATMSWTPDDMTPAQRKAVTRAMRSFVRKYPQYALTGGGLSFYPLTGRGRDR
jgi:hypothetical protein